MKFRSADLVQFISRTFLAAFIAILVGSGVLLALFYLRNGDEQRATSSREVSRLARQVEIASLRRLAVLRGHIAFGAPVTIEALGIGDRALASQLDSLLRSAADVPVQRERAQRIVAAFARWDSTLKPPDIQRPGIPVLRVDRARAEAAESAFGPLASDVAAFLATEEQLYDEKTAAAHQLDQVFVGSAFLAMVIILAALYLLRVQLLAQARETTLSETRFRTLVESLHDVVFTLGHEKRYTGMFGSTADAEMYKQFVGKTPVEILGAEQGEVHMNAAERALRGETVSYDWTIAGGSTTIHFTNTVSPLRGPDGDIVGVVGMARDVTDQVTRAHELADAREQLRQAQRLDALGQLAGGVAHDFNNLLTIIMTYAEILKEDAEPGSDNARSIDEIRLASDRAAALTRQLLAFGRRQVLQPRATDLNETVREVESMLRRVLPPDVIVGTNLSSSLGLVMADPGQIEQVLINLAINARDAMPDGGHLTFGTANVDRTDERSGMKGPHVVVTVTDTGTGMSPETKARIFEPFFTTKGLGKGTGLGLATVHGIVEQSGGRVTLDSAVGRGTVFHIRLPVHVPTTAASPTAETGTDPALGGSETILLVDDNEELRRVVKRMLSRAGYDVVEAASGAAALAHLDRGGRVHLVLTDVMMPDMNGRAVVEAVRQRHRAVRLLLMSGYNYDQALRGMAQRGDVDFIEKPFTAETLLRRLRDLLELSSNRGAA
jgi:PAS domain S-box-containing protein